MQLLEKFYPWKDGSPGGWYKDDDGTVHELHDWETMNNRENFEDAARQKGAFAWFAYTHNIGNYFFKKQDRSFWLGKEAHYDEDHFFYITGIPGMEDKRVAFQLRVANHPTKHAQWEESHCNGKDSTGRVIRPDLKADFCLSLIINPLGRAVDAYNKMESVKTKMASIECDFDYDSKTPEEKAEIDRIIKEITDGKQPTIEYDTIVSLFGGKEPRSTGPGEYRPHNFSSRQNQFFNRGAFYNFIKTPEQTPKKSPESVVRTSVNFDELPMDLKDGDIVEIDGRKYKYDADNYVLYLGKVKRQRGKKGKNDEEELVYDESNPIPIELTEQALKLTIEDICEAVRRVIKCLI